MGLRDVVSERVPRAPRASRPRSLGAQPGVETVSLTELDAASLRRGRGWDWPIELEAALDASDLARGTSCATLLADLRLLGMRPAVAVADPAKTQILRPAR